MNDEKQSISAPIDTLLAKIAPGPCQFCGKPDSRNLIHGKPCCDACWRKHISEIEAEDLVFLGVNESETHWRKECPREFRQKIDRSKLQNTSAFDTVTDWEYGPTGLLISGTTGFGKTRAVWGLLYKQNALQGRSFVFYDGYDFSSAAADAARSGKEREWMKQMTTVDIFAFDDLGKNKARDTVEGALFAIIDKRTSCGMPCIFTTQHNAASLMAVFIDELNGQAALRRLKQYCTPVNF